MLGVPALNRNMHIIAVKIAGSAALYVESPRFFGISRKRRFLIRRGTYSVDRDHDYCNLCMFRITTQSGAQYLVHKGPNFGNKSDAVIVDAKHMSRAWEVLLF